MMCISSAVSDYYQNTYPARNPQMYPWVGTPPPPVVHSFDPETKDLLRQALKILDKIDKRLGDIECMDESKKAFLAAIGMKPEELGG